jgi:hypothetical protein
MTDVSRMSVQGLVGKVLADENVDDVLRQAVAWLAEQLMEAEVTAAAGAGYGERSGDRVAGRNGYWERAWDTRIGSIELAILKLRAGSYFPGFLEPRRRSEQALVAVVQEAYVNGVSTRKVDRLVEALGLAGVSKDQVSRLCQGLDEQVTADRRHGNCPSPPCGTTRTRQAPGSSAARGRVVRRRSVPGGGRPPAWRLRSGRERLACPLPAWRCRCAAQPRAGAARRRGRRMPNSPTSNRRCWRGRRDR